jgi:hypothetical protein
VFRRRFDWECSREEKVRLVARVTTERDLSAILELGFDQLVEELISLRFSIDN